MVFPYSIRMQHIGAKSFRPQSRQVAQLFPLQPLQVFFLDQLIDGFLDIGDFGREAGFDLLNGFLDKLNVLHLLSRLHDANNRGLRKSYQ